MSYLAVKVFTKGKDQQEIENFLSRGTAVLPQEAP